MDEIKQLISTDMLKTSLLAEIPEKRSSLYFRYNKVSDTLMLLVTSPETETIVHYMDENVAILYIPNSNEVVGFQIEDFTVGFLPKYQALQRKWRMAAKGIHPVDFGDLTIAVEEQKLEVAIQIVRSAEPRIGKAGKELERALEYACV
jgi:hypothetical protein